MVKLTEKLVENSLVVEADRESVVHSLDDLILETAYESWDEADKQTLILSLLRRNCVTLAGALADAGHKHSALDAWRVIGETDPLPEVRWG